MLYHCAQIVVWVMRFVPNVSSQRILLTPRRYTHLSTSEPGPEIYPNDVNWPQNIKMLNRIFDELAISELHHRRIDLKECISVYLFIGVFFGLEVLFLFLGGPGLLYILWTRYKGIHVSSFDTETLRNMHWYKQYLIFCLIRRSNLQFSNFFVYFRCVISQMS